VAPPQTCAELRQEADEVICPYQPDPFWAIGLFYQNFAPTEDSEVESLLRQTQTSRNMIRPASDRARPPAVTKPLEASTR